MSDRLKDELIPEADDDSRAVLEYLHKQPVYYLPNVPSKRIQDFVTGKSPYLYKFFLCCKIHVPLSLYNFGKEAFGRAELRRDACAMVSFVNLLMAAAQETNLKVVIEGVADQACVHDGEYMHEFCQAHNLWFLPATAQQWQTFCSVVARIVIENGAEPDARAKRMRTSKGAAKNTGATGAYNCMSNAVTSPEKLIAALRLIDDQNVERFAAEGIVFDSAVVQGPEPAAEVEDLGWSSDEPDATDLSVTVDPTAVGTVAKNHFMAPFVVDEDYETFLSSRQYDECNCPEEQRDMRNYISGNKFRVPFSTLAIDIDWADFGNASMLNFVWPHMRPSLHALRLALKENYHGAQADIGTRYLDRLSDADMWRKLCCGEIVCPSKVKPIEVPKHVCERGSDARNPNEIAMRMVWPGPYVAKEHIEKVRKHLGGTDIIDRAISLTRRLYGSPERKDVPAVYKEVRDFCAFCEERFANASDTSSRVALAYCMPHLRDWLGIRQRRRDTGATRVSLSSYRMWRFISDTRVAVGMNEAQIMAACCVYFWGGRLMMFKNSTILLLIFCGDVAEGKSKALKFLKWVIPAFLLHETHTASDKAKNRIIDCRMETVDDKFWVDPKKNAQTASADRSGFADGYRRYDTNEMNPITRKWVPVSKYFPQLTICIIATNYEPTDPAIASRAVFGAFMTSPHAKPTVDHMLTPKNADFRTGIAEGNQYLFALQGTFWELGSVGLFEVDTTMFFVVMAIAKKLLGAEFPHIRRLEHIMFNAIGICAGRLTYEWKTHVGQVYNWSEPEKARALFLSSMAFLTCGDVVTSLFQTCTLADLGQQKEEMLRALKSLVEFTPGHERIPLMSEDNLYYQTSVPVDNFKDAFDATLLPTLKGAVGVIRKVFNELQRQKARDGRPVLRVQGTKHERKLQLHIGHARSIFSAQEDFVLSGLLEYSKMGVRGNTDKKVFMCVLSDYLPKDPIKVVVPTLSAAIVKGVRETGVLLGASPQRLAEIKAQIASLGEVLVHCGKDEKMTPGTEIELRNVASVGGIPADKLNGTFTVISFSDGVATVQTNHGEWDADGKANIRSGSGGGMFVSMKKPSAAEPDDEDDMWLASMPDLHTRVNNPMVMVPGLPVAAAWQADTDAKPDVKIRQEQNITDDICKGVYFLNLRSEFQLQQNGKTPEVMCAQVMPGNPPSTATMGEVMAPDSPLRQFHGPGDMYFNPYRRAGLLIKFSFLRDAETRMTDSKIDGEVMSPAFKKLITTAFAVSGLVVPGEIITIGTHPRSDQTFVDFVYDPEEDMSIQCDNPASIAPELNGITVPALSSRCSGATSPLDTDFYGDMLDESLDGSTAPVSTRSSIFDPSKPHISLDANSNLLEKIRYDHNQNLYGVDALPVFHSEYSSYPNLDRDCDWPEPPPDMIVTTGSSGEL